MKTTDENSNLKKKIESLEQNTEKEKEPKKIKGVIALFEYFIKLLR